jgi:hypothetical protein
MPDRAQATRPERGGQRVPGIAVMLLAGLLAGCGGMPFGKDEPSAETTGSISPVPTAAPVAPTVDPSDWEAIRRTVAMALVTGENTTHNWVNPDTGSSGTVTQTVELVAQKDMRCRLFATTLNDFRGSRRFRGQICQQTDGRWVLVSVTPDDAALS